VKNSLKQYYVMHDQKSLMSRRRATKTCTSLHQVELMNVFTHGALDLPRRKRCVYNAMSHSNEADIIGPVVFEPWKTSWTLPFALKKELFGQNRREVGGQTDAEQAGENVDEADDDEAMNDVPDDTLPGVAEMSVSPGRDSKLARTDTNVEVVFLHSWPEAFYTEIVHSFCLKGVVDMTAGAGAAALACIKGKRQYLGCCLTDVHVRLLEQQLLVKVFNEMLDEESKLHCLELTKAITVVSAQSAKGKPKSADPKAGPPKKKAKLATKKKAKKDTSKGEESEPGSADPEESDPEESE
jgi:hypothetical protein